MTTAIITTCMGRLAHLKQALASFVEHTPFPIYVVDMECPDGAGRYALETYPSRARIVNVKARREPNSETPLFHKTAALNAGANQAEVDGAKTLVFLDADVIIRKEFQNHVSQVRERFLIASAKTPHLTGLLALPTRMFRRSGAFNERFCSYGCEDLELRVRLLKQGYDFSELPPGLALSLTHADALRVEHYAEKDVIQSGKQNLALLMRLHRLQDIGTNPKLRRLLAG